MSVALPTFRSVVLPREHGSWALAFEPVALGLLVAPSAGGGWLALALVSAFLARRPLTLAATLPTDDPRRAPALRWLLLFATVALAAFLLSADPGGRSLIEQGAPFATHWPLLLALPFAAAFVGFELRGGTRAAGAGLAGSTAFALVPAAFATLAGWGTPAALALAVLALARSVPTVLTVRAYLRGSRSPEADAAPAWAATFAAMLSVLALAWHGLAPAFAGVLALVFVARAAVLLAPWRPAWSARQVGQLEGALGILFLAGLTVAYRLA